MSEQEPKTETYGDNLATFDKVPPPDVWIMRDETGQPWAISVRPDGQLQTAKYPDGEPMTVCHRGAPNAEKIRDKIAESFRALGLMLTPEEYEKYLSEKIADRTLDNFVKRISE